MSTATAAVLKSEARLFAREPANVFWIVGFPPVLLVILGCIPAFREAKPDLQGQTVVGLYVPICVLLGLIVAGFQAMPPVLTGYRETGVLRRMSATPVRPT
jgi:ABC-2 type transport system permease protein